MKFIADVHLGKLARYLRLCGFDTLFDTRYTDPEIMRISKSEGRIILTRDRELLNNRKAIGGLLVRSQDPGIQLKDVFDHLGLKSMVKPFTRCMECNGLIEEVSKEMIQDRLQPNTMLYYDRFFLCRQCDHVYWEASHFKRMKEYVDKLVRNC